MKPNGRRGAFLVLLGLIYLAYGATLATTEPDASVRHSMSWMPPWSPLWACGLVWMAAGIVACVCALQPMPRDRLGFQALSAVGVAWTIAYLIGWITGHSHRGYASALIFGALALAVLVVSGMPNPVPARTTGGKA